MNSAPFFSQMLSSSRLLCLCTICPSNWFYVLRVSVGSVSLTPATIIYVSRVFPSLQSNPLSLSSYLHLPSLPCFDSYLYIQMSALAPLCSCVRSRSVTVSVSLNIIHIHVGYLLYLQVYAPCAPAIDSGQRCVHTRLAAGHVTVPCRPRQISRETETVSLKVSRCPTCTHVRGGKVAVYGHVRVRVVPRWSCGYGSEMLTF